MPSSLPIGSSYRSHIGKIFLLPWIYHIYQCGHILATEQDVTSHMANPLFGHCCQLLSLKIKNAEVFNYCLAPFSFPFAYLAVSYHFCSICSLFPCHLQQLKKKNSKENLLEVCQEKKGGKNIS